MHDQSNIIFFVLDLLLEFVAHAMDGIRNKVLTHLFLNKERVSHQQIIHCSKVILFKQFENRKKINHFKTIEGSHCSENFVLSISFQQKEFSHLIFLFSFSLPSEALLLLLLKWWFQKSAQKLWKLWRQTERHNYKEHKKMAD